MPFIGNKPTAVPLSGDDIQDGTIGLADLSATGTKDSTTFLRGDNTFAEAGGGKVLQVLQTVVTNRQSGSTSTFTDVSGLSVSITPSATSSKILVMTSLTANSPNQYMFARIMRDTTAICIADVSNSNTRASFGNFFVEQHNWQTYSQTFLDSPATTSATTYKIQTFSDSGTWYINYGGSTDTDASRGNGVSTITVMEIGA